MGNSASRDMILWFFLTIFLSSLLLLAWLIWPFVSIIILATVVTGVFSPVYRFFYVKDKINAPFASFLTCVLIFLVLLVPILFFVGVLSKEAYDLYIMAKNAVISDRIKNLFETSQVLERANFVLAKLNLELSVAEFNRAISELGKVVGLFLYNQVSSIATNTLKFLVNFFFMLLIIYYLLIDGGKLVNFIIELSPLPTEQDEKLIQKFRDMAGAILIGNGLGGLIQGTLGGIVFAFFGMKSPFLWGVIMSLLAFLPIVGIGIVFIPAAIYLFLAGRIGGGIFFIFFYVILSGGIEYLFKPRLVGHRVQMHTLLVFLAIMGGLNLFGILGIIYGPLIVTLFLTLTDIYHAKYRNFVEPFNK